MEMDHRVRTWNGTTGGPRGLRGGGGVRTACRTCPLVRAPVESRTKHPRIPQDLVARSFYRFGSPRFDERTAAQTPNASQLFTASMSPACCSAISPLFSASPAGSAERSVERHHTITPRRPRRPLGGSVRRLWGLGEGGRCCRTKTRKREGGTPRPQKPETTTACFVAITTRP